MASYVPVPKAPKAWIGEISNPKRLAAPEVPVARSGMYRSIYGKGAAGPRIPFQDMGQLSNIAGDMAGAFLGRTKKAKPEPPGRLQGPVMVAPPLIKNNPRLALGSGPTRIGLGAGPQPSGAIENTGDLPLGLGAGPLAGSPENPRTVGMPKAIGQQFPGAIDATSTTRPRRASTQAGMDAKRMAAYENTGPAQWSSREPSSPAQQQRPARGSGPVIDASSTDVTNAPNAYAQGPGTVRAQGTAPIQSQGMTSMERTQRNRDQQTATARADARFAIHALRPLTDAQTNLANINTGGKLPYEAPRSGMGANAGKKDSLLTPENDIKSPRGKKNLTKPLTREVKGAPKGGPAGKPVKKSKTRAK